MYLSIYIFISNETESKQYVDQLLKRQNDSLALENTNSSVSDEVSF